MKNAPGWLKWANGIFSVLVFASVVLVKQHLLLDILGGIVLGEVALALRKLFRAERAMYRIVPQQWQKEKEI
jgi:membrane-associated phospholipid phosphatase